MLISQLSSGEMCVARMFVGPRCRELFVQIKVFTKIVVARDKSFRTPEKRGRLSDAGRHLVGPKWKQIFPHLHATAAARAHLLDDCIRIDGEPIKVQKVTSFGTSSDRLRLSETQFRLDTCKFNTLRRLFIYQFCRNL